MEIAFLLVLLAVAVLAGTSLSERIGFPAPLALIALGAVGAWLPFVPEVHLHPEVVLLGLLPLLLYAAALQTSLVDFNANRRPILLLSVGLVVFTTVGVGAVVHALLPGIGWAPALAIGAVVAPPDAVAATAIARRIGLPRRLVTILEGESLLNDATALVALRTAIAASAGAVSLTHVGLDFAKAAGGGVLVGLLAFVVVAKVRKLLTDPVLDTAVSLVTRSRRTSRPSGSTPPASSRWSSPACCSVTRRRSCSPRRAAWRSGPTGRRSPSSSRTPSSS